MRLKFKITKDLAKKAYDLKEGFVSLIDRVDEAVAEFIYDFDVLLEEHEMDVYLTKDEKKEVITSITAPPIESEDGPMDLTNLGLVKKTFGQTEKLILEDRVDVNGNRYTTLRPPMESEKTLEPDDVITKVLTSKDVMNFLMKKKN